MPTGTRLKLRPEERREYYNRYRRERYKNPEIRARVNASNTASRRRARAEASRSCRPALNLRTRT
jgi:hypothetical protein